MGSSRDIKTRIKAVGNIKRITRTMQMIATSKFAKAQQTALAAKPYSEALNDLVGQLAAGVGEDATHPLLRAADLGAPELTLLLASDRGLCGPYNGSVIRTAMAHFREHAQAREGRVEIVGKKGVSVLKFAGIPIARHHTHFGDAPAVEDINRLASEYVDAFTSGEISCVRIVSMRYISAGRQMPVIQQLLPFDTGGAGESAAGGNYEFSPSAEGLLGSLLPAAVRSLLLQAFNEALVSEHIARMVAMKAATDNAGKMGNLLKRKYNRARQAQITTELTEIISGAAALE